MDEFPFMINLNYKMSDFEIKPPSSLYHLKEVACSKYDLKLAEMVYITEEGEQKPLDTEEQYFEMISYATGNELKQIEIVIKKNENTSERRKESLRKKSSMKNEYENLNRKGKSNLPRIKDIREDDEDIKEGGDGGSDDGEVGMQCDYDYFGDTRNRKGGIEEDEYVKKNKGFKEEKRVYYIKEKKKRQREEDLKKNQVEEEEEEEDKSRKRIKKEFDKNDKNFENNTVQLGPKSNKKKKKPKKDRVRF